MARQKSQKKFFWVVLVSILIISGGKISATFADTPSGELIINEFVAANGSGLTDEDGDHADWIEIYNASDTALNLAGWALTDDPNQPQKWPFPDLSLGSHQYLIVFASGKNRFSTEAGGFLHTNFKLSKEGEFLALHNILEGKFIDTISPQYPEQIRDKAYGRYGEERAFGFLSIPTPGEPNDDSFAWAGSVSPVVFNVEHGFYEAPFTVELSVDTAGAAIRYTSDGSAPAEDNGAIYAGPVSIQMTTVLRAAAFKPGFLPSAINTQSYIFPDEVLTHFSLDGSQPADSQSGIKAQPAAAGSKAPPERAAEGGPGTDLKSIPSVSLVMDANGLAQLRAEPQEKGRDSERAVSFELIDPSREQAGPQINAGIRPYGESAESSPKHAFRLFFRSDYGSTKLEYPLFADSQVELFDTLILRPVETGNLAAGLYAANEWLRASQIAMSGLGAHGMFVNLYLNGQYAGLYNLIERPDANFMSAYLGSQQEDWFVANQAGPLADDLNPAANKLNYLFTALALAPTLDAGTTPPEYVADTYAAAAKYLEPAQLIDYVLLNWYADSLDWPENSWYAAIRQQDLPGRGKLLIADWPAGSKDRLEADQTASPQRNVHESFLETLMQNPDFKVEFADRLYRHLRNDGPLSNARAQARWQELNAALDQAILTESALWANMGDQPALKRDDWLDAQDRVLGRMEGNAARLVARAREAGYYPEFDPPVLSHNGGLVETEFSLTMSPPPGACQNCSIYYTTDRSDPRLPVSGTVIPNAVLYNGPIVLTRTTRIKARIWDGQSWSALQEATFSVVEQDNKLRVTEIMYNPAGGDDFEFIELQNLGSRDLDLAGISLEEGVRFTFPPNAEPLGPGEIAVLVSNPEIFAERYPDVPINGAYEGHLSNKGERFILKDAAGQTLLDVEYDDDNGWPISADGRGDSLSLVDPAGNPDEARNWRASIDLYGSPGVAEPLD